MTDEPLLPLLEEARDLLMEKRYGNPARSPGHNARLAIESAIKVLNTRSIGAPPREPTEEMALAGRKACAAVADRMELAKQVAVSVIDFWQRVGHQPANEIWKAMYDAFLRQPRTEQEMRGDFVMVPREMFERAISYVELTASEEAGEEAAEAWHDKNEMRALLEVASPRPSGVGGDWQDISTAPKDGTLLLLHGGWPRTVIGHWSDKEGRWYIPVRSTGITGYIMADDEQPTHWILLPASPSAPTTGEGKR